jgi:chemotaxis protein MotA
MGAVLAGFTMAGGHVGALIHPSEIVTICGAAIGALIIMSPTRVLRDVMRAVLQLFKGSPYNKQTYFELFKLLYGLSKIARRDGMLALESHINNPAQSAIFKKCPRITQNHHALGFICDGLGLLVDGKIEKAQIHAWLEEEIKVIEREHHAAVGALAKTADALPGFGIVAAVLGIVVTMQAINGPVEEIGHKVGAALVGTFLGILISYGFIAPMTGRMEILGEEETVFFHSVIAAIVALSEGMSPKDVVNCARRSVGTDCRPSQGEMNQLIKEGDSA